MKLTKSQLKEMIREELKLTEDFKNSEWEVYVADEKGREKVVKKAKSKRAATILYNKIIKSDDYWEVGMRVVKEGKLTEAKFKSKQKISKKEWRKIKSFNKHIGQDGTHYVMQLTNKGTALVPVIVEGKLNEDDYASKYADMIDEIRERVMFKSTNIVMMLNQQDKMSGTKNAKAYNKLIDTHFRKFIIGAKKIQKMIKD